MSFTRNCYFLYKSALCIIQNQSGLEKKSILDHFFFYRCVLYIIIYLKFYD